MQSCMQIAAMIKFKIIFLPDNRMQKQVGGKGWKGEGMLIHLNLRRQFNHEKGT